jgi:hypothetical protein
MAGDVLPPRAHDCPRCGRSRIVSGKKHCDSPSCEWVKCLCRTTYEMHGPGSYHPDDFKDKETT